MCYVHISSCYAITIFKTAAWSGLTKCPVLKQFLVANLHISAKQEHLPLVTYDFSEQGCTDKLVIFAEQQIS